MGMPSPDFVLGPTVGALLLTLSSLVRDFLRCISLRREIAFARRVLNVRLALATSSVTIICITVFAVRWLYSAADSWYVTFFGVNIFRGEPWLWMAVVAGFVSLFILPCLPRDVAGERTWSYLVARGIALTLNLILVGILIVVLLDVY